MSSDEGAVNEGKEDRNINFQDLDILLQQCLNEKELQVITHTITKLLPAGENYGSIILKIDVTIRKNRLAKEQMLHLVAKTPSCVENSLIEWPLIFKKELFMYANLFPSYRELEKEAGINENELINVLPKYVGFRNSLKNSGEVDNNSVLLLENLKVKGFYTLNRRTGLNIYCARKVLPLLARYHVLGIALQQKRPSFAKKVIDQARILGTDFTQLDSGFAAIHETFKISPRLQKYLAAIEPSFQLIIGGGTWKAAPIEPWASITHGDFWTSNILFHADDSGNIDDVKFVDFQGYLYSSPLKDLIPFFTTCIDELTQTEHLEELVDLYYNAFVETLKRMNCDILPFTRKSFDSELKKQAIDQFPICALAKKFMVTQVVDEDDKNNEELLQSVFNAGASDAFIDRLMWIFEIYERMEWI